MDMSVFDLMHLGMVSNDLDMVEVAISLHPAIVHYTDDQVKEFLYELGRRCLLSELLYSPF